MVSVSPYNKVFLNLRLRSSTLPLDVCVFYKRAYRRLPSKHISQFFLTKKKLLCEMSLFFKFIGWRHRSARSQPFCILKTFIKFGIFATNCCSISRLFFLKGPKRLFVSTDVCSYSLFSSSDLFFGCFSWVFFDSLSIWTKYRKDLFFHTKLLKENTYSYCSFQDISKRV